MREPHVPVLVSIHDFYLTNIRSSRNANPEQQADAARAAVHLALCAFYRAGYIHVREEMRNNSISNEQGEGEADADALL